MCSSSDHCSSFNQIEGCFVQGIGFFTNEDYKTNSDGLVIHDGTWTYKIPTVDNIPKEFNVQMFNSARDKKRVLSSKGKHLLTMFHFTPLSTFMQTFSASDNRL
jgi:xanthine dehydrogenase molybdopterin-binding subunit B